LKRAGKKKNIIPAWLTVFDLLLRSHVLMSYDSPLDCIPTICCKTSFSLCPNSEIIAAVTEMATNARLSLANQYSNDNVIRPLVNQYSNDNVIRTKVPPRFEEDQHCLAGPL
jgi:cobalamin biosynthesis protein CobD/CbiB